MSRVEIKLFLNLEMLDDRCIFNLKVHWVTLFFTNDRLSAEITIQRKLRSYSRLLEPMDWILLCGLLIILFLSETSKASLISSRGKMSSWTKVSVLRWINLFINCKTKTNQWLSCKLEYKITFMFLNFLLKMDHYTSRF